MSKKYVTSDLALAAALAALRHAVIEIDRSERRRVTFGFEETADLQKAIDQYWRNQLRVDALSYWNALRTLKARLYSEAES